MELLEIISFGTSGWHCRLNRVDNTCLYQRSDRPAPKVRQVGNKGVRQGCTKGQTGLYQRSERSAPKKSERSAPKVSERSAPRFRQVGTKGVRPVGTKGQTGRQQGSAGRHQGSDRSAARVRPDL